MADEKVKTFFFLIVVVVGVEDEPAASPLPLLVLVVFLGDGFSDISSLMTLVIVNAGKSEDASVSERAGEGYGFFLAVLFESGEGNGGGDASAPDELAIVAVCFW